MRSTSSWLPTPRTSDCAHCWRRLAASLKSWGSRSACPVLHTHVLCWPPRTVKSHWHQHLSLPCKSQLSLLLLGACKCGCKLTEKRLAGIEHHETPHSASICLNCNCSKQSCHDNPTQIMLHVHCSQQQAPSCQAHLYMSFVLMCACTK